jgi:hypothetical protein
MIETPAAATDPAAATGADFSLESIGQLFVCRFLNEFFRNAEIACFTCPAQARLSSLFDGCICRGP